MWCGIVPILGLIGVGFNTLGGAAVGCGGAVSCCWEVGLGINCGLLTGGVVGGMIGCLAVFCPSSTATC
eukprot:7116986-Ditylum_brightwellii.AAC.1